MKRNQLLTAPIIGREFTMQIRQRLGNDVAEASAILVERPDAFGPVPVIEVRWGKMMAYLQPGRTALSMSLDDYSRLFVQPQIEAWIAQQQRIPM